MDSFHSPPEPFRAEQTVLSSTKQSDLHDGWSNVILGIGSIRNSSKEFRAVQFQFATIKEGLGQAVIYLHGAYFKPHLILTVGIFSLAFVALPYSGYYCQGMLPKFSLAFVLTKQRLGKE